MQFKNITLILFLMFGYHVHAETIYDYDARSRSQVGSYEHSIYTKVGIVTVVHPDRTRSECSGVLVAEKSVLVAGTCLVTPKEALSEVEYYERTKTLRRKAFAASEEIYFTPGQLSTGSYMRGHFKAQGIEVAKRFRGHNNFRVNHNFAIIQLEQSPGLGHVEMMDLDDIENIQAGSLDVIGHIFNEETGSQDMWHDRLFFEKNGKNWSAITRLDMPPFNDFHATPAFIRVGRDYKLIGVLAYREGIDKMARALVLDALTLGIINPYSNGPIARLFRRIGCGFKIGLCGSKSSYLIAFKNNLLQELQQYSQD